jgi:hypothetical protein
MQMWCEIYLPQPCKITKSPEGPNSEMDITYTSEFRAGPTLQVLNVHRISENGFLQARKPQPPEI